MAAQILNSQELNRLLTSRPGASELPNASLDSPVLNLLASTGRQGPTELITEQHYAPGEIVFKEGDIGDAMYIVRSGRAVKVKGDLKSPTVLGHLGIGEIVGEMTLLEDQPRSVSVIAVENLRLLRISRDDFQHMLSQRPTLGMSILRALSSRLRAVDEAHKKNSLIQKRLIHQVSKLQTEKQQLLEKQRLHQDTIDLVIHDLRNPLGVIATVLNMLEMVLPEDVRETNQELLDLGNINCEYMTRLVDSLLDVAQMEAGESELLLEKVDLSELIQNTVDRMAASLRRDDVTLQSAIPSELPAITIDEEKIDRVLANLIDNAIKYTSERGRVTISAAWRAEDVVVSITNTGESIPPKNRERIFERFAHVGGVARIRGFGLGLAFCRLAVEAHGGRIWVEPGENGSGNRFLFSLPLSLQTDATTVLS